MKPHVHSVSRAPSAGSPGLGFFSGIFLLFCQIGRYASNIRQSNRVSHSLPAPTKIQATPNLSLNSDPACIVWRALSSSRYLGFAQRLGAGGAG